MKPTPPRAPRKCEYRLCERLVEQAERGRRRRFCCDEHKDAHHNKTSGAVRTSTSRAIRGWRSHVPGMLWARPTSTTGRDIQLFDEVEGLEAQSEAGLLRYEVRSNIRHRAMASLEVVRRDPSRSRDEAIAAARLLQLLARVGVEGPRLGRSGAAALCAFANEAIAIFRNVDSRNHARSVLLAGIVYDMCRQPMAAASRYQFAWSLVKGVQPVTADVAGTKFHAAVRYLRYFKNDDACEQAKYLAEEFPTLEGDYLQERAGYEGRIGNFTQSQQQLVKLEEVFDARPPSLPYDLLRAVKTSVWSLLQSGQVKAAERCLHDHYAKACTGFPDAFSVEQVGRWNMRHRDLRVPAVPDAEYRIAILPGLPHYCVPLS